MNQILVISEDYPLEIELTLPYKGTVLVHTGQRVKSGELIAEASLPTHYEFFDLQSEFGIKAHQIADVLQRKVGESLTEGDVIASKKGIINRFFRATENGSLLSARDGRLYIGYGEEKIQLLAPHPGVISEILTGKGVMLANQSVVVQAELMHSSRASGAFVRLTDEELLRQPHRLDRELKDVVLWLDGPFSERVWGRIKGLDLAGLVLASLPASSPALRASSQLPVLLIMGVGDLELDSRTRAVLMQMLGMVVMLEPKARLGGFDRPAIFRRWDFESHPFGKRPLPELQTGSEVRLLGKPYQGMLAVVEELPERTEVFPSGARSKIAVLRIAEKTLIRLPLTNLELIVS